MTFQSGNLVMKIDAKGGHIDFMFLSPSNPATGSATELVKSK